MTVTDIMVAHNEHLEHIGDRGQLKGHFVEGTIEKSLAAITRLLEVSSHDTMTDLR